MKLQFRFFYFIMALFSQFLLWFMCASFYSLCVEGSMRYMSPELINPKADGYDYPADIWSFGCTVVEMLTRKLPYSEVS